MPLNNKCANPSKQPHSGVTLLESAHWLLKCMIKVIASLLTNTEVNYANKT